MIFVELDCLFAFRLIGVESGIVKSSFQMAAKLKDESNERLHIDCL